ncbi:LysR family transcriptional regulator [Parasphingopyxis sp. CP4]|uniref:LysR family transcriptional regulator n=1 Tax=Parasphingopyxis sp. CP4 TaxID=2724527 RepID=UPI0015A1BB3D|nr:LysR family transcriptional regulator [Parasphingopyxis sp. CP4]QLC22176.1 LysR family transcriptional regulator [Parasphingopyxis sp. CP4]
MLRHPDPDWEDIKTFNAVMDAGTVRSAAQKLGVHHSTVSRRIESLERTLQVRLFDRRPEGYAPTQAGEELASIADEFGAELTTISRRIAGRDDMLPGKLTVTMAEPLAVGIFAPKLSEFCEAYPGLELDIRVTYEELDVARREADIAVRMNNNPPDTLVGKRFFPYHMSIYASPDYLKSHDLVNDPKSARWLGWGDDDEEYPEWTQSTEYARVPVWGAFDRPTVQIGAVQAGLGIAMLPCMMGDVAPGLVRATDRKPTPARDIWVLTHNDLRRTARVRAFMDFAESVIRANKPLLVGDLVANG